MNINAGTITATESIAVTGPLPFFDGASIVVTVAGRQLQSEPLTRAELDTLSRELLAEGRECTGLTVTAQVTLDGTLTAVTTRLGDFHRWMLFFTAVEDARNSL